MRLIDADALKIKVEAMVEHRVIESDYDFGRNQAFDYVADNLIEDAPTIDAVERIEYEKMKDLAEQYKFEYECVFESLKEVLNEVLPNRVEVVRCKDCKFAEQCHMWIKFKGVDLDHRYNNLQFCSYGKREEE